MAVYPITEPPGRLGVITAYLMIYVVWGSTYYFIGTALQGFPPFLLGGMRFCTAGLLLLLAGADFSSLGSFAFTVSKAA